LQTLEKFTKTALPTREKDSPDPIKNEKLKLRIEV